MTLLLKCDHCGKETKKNYAYYDKDGLDLCQECFLKSEKEHAERACRYEKRSLEEQMVRAEERKKETISRAEERVKQLNSKRVRGRIW